MTLRDVPDFVQLDSRVRQPALSLLASKRELAGYDQLRARRSWWSVWVLLVLGPAAVGRILVFASQHSDSVITDDASRVREGLMSVPGVEQVAAVVAREQVDVARRELTARARQAGPGVAMVGGGGLLVALASGTGTAALILLLGRRPGAAAALGVTGAYAGAGAWLAREGLVRLREAAPSLPDVPVQDEPVQDAKQELGSAAKRGTKSAAKSAGRAKSAAKSPPQPAGRPKPKSKSRAV